ncbi:hypothetical protein K443DRAFT_682746 [Laccaria amethystina LaAM-08-1]|uniref:Unplaced genomic scaffold K443scaffold_207, whole genome shotgun sequence n=1 Tax=Laccaria amethystina LaAM-08-1 TaxID=1095629 RepID=A0A0C9WUC8_9AGAR|nr:hypothetical protein K443DRAFT_682746 [Laccaria amethystina LaAM-08-1]
MTYGQGGGQRPTLVGVTTDNNIHIPSKEPTVSDYFISNKPRPFAGRCDCVNFNYPSFENRWVGWHFR